MLVCESSHKDLYVRFILQVNVALLLFSLDVILYQSESHEQSRNGQANEPTRRHTVDNRGWQFLGRVTSPRNCLNFLLLLF